MEYAGYHQMMANAERAQYKYLNKDRMAPKWINSNRIPRDPRAVMAWKKHREANWNSSVRTYAPLAFKGIKPITMEPWATDAILYECEHDRIGGRQTRDVQAQMLDEAIAYRAALRTDRLIKKALGERAYDC